MTVSALCISSLIFLSICTQCLSFTLHQNSITAVAARVDLSFLKIPAQTLRISRETSRRISNDDYPAEALDNRQKGENKFQRLMREYGPLYFQVWFCIYLPFLLSFFYILDNNLLASTPFRAFDPQAAITPLFNWLVTVSNDLEFTRGIRENPRATSFATAYLMADLVPTSFFAVATTVAIKCHQKNQLNLEGTVSDV